MPSYVRKTIADFIRLDPNAIIGSLQRAYAADGFVSQYTRQTKAWVRVIPLLQESLQRLIAARPESSDWQVILEYPLYRLRRRIDLVIIAGNTVVVVECKISANGFLAQDRRQVEEYALDLRDFHAASHTLAIIPILWSTDAPASYHTSQTEDSTVFASNVARTVTVGSEGLHHWLATLPLTSVDDCIDGESWDQSPYRPVPSVIEAATSIFAGHDVRSIANADADNLRVAASRLVSLIHQAREQGRRYLLLLTGVPGSGKTLAGLDVVHSAVATGVEHAGDIVYLSGNTPLVTVLREALSQDEAARCRARGERKSLDEVRRDVRTRIQHINDFLQQGLRGASTSPPHEHVIVFDEAQRAWDEKQGKEKFNRTASEPSILLELMSRHLDWCACICLVGGGQEINTGEEGVFGWGEALRALPSEERQRWSVFAPPDVLGGGPSAGSFTLGELPNDLAVSEEQALQLRVPQRSYRSPSVSQWVNCVLKGDAAAAVENAKSLGDYPILITRSLEAARRHLRELGRGERRYGLVASSGARRLRAEGLGLTLNATAGTDIAHWYLNPPGDIRACYQLEVPANEYACQGLELDFVCLCWGGDLLWDPHSETWLHSRLSGTEWQTVQDAGRQRFLKNSYRVLLTRAREGMILWVPEGSDTDRTRAWAPLAATADFLTRCGAKPISP